MWTRRAAGYGGSSLAPFRRSPNALCNEPSGQSPARFIAQRNADGAPLVAPDDPPHPTALALETGEAAVWFGKKLARSHDAPERASYERAWWIRFACVRWSCCACGSVKNRALHGDPMNAQSRESAVAKSGTPQKRRYESAI